MSVYLQPKQKQTLQLSLKLWLPLLQAPLQDLEQIFKDHSYENPFLECRSSLEATHSSLSSSDDKRGFIENMTVYKDSFYDVVLDQINAPLFPTPNSQKVALEVLNHINDEGYFEGSEEKIAITCNTTKEFVGSVRARFAKLEPYGIGACDMKESFLFQLSLCDLDEKLYSFTEKMIKNIHQMDRFCEHPFFDDAKNVMKKFNSPPAIEYKEEQPCIIPDFFVDVEDDIRVRINSGYYPDVVVSDAFNAKNTQLREKLKEARDLVNLLSLRKSTLYKLVLLIVEKQVRFFIGSELAPLTMAQIAQELGFDESTISRAVSNKYIQCKRGTFSLKSFFTNALTGGLSSSEIKNYITKAIKNENHEKPLTDQDLAEMIKERFKMELVRRTITKYRKLLSIPSSKERKKIYKMTS